MELRRIPTAWKTAIVVPIFKDGDKKDVCNYRPVSITSCCSHILERIINDRIVDHLATNNLITVTQHGFQRGRSTVQTPHFLASMTLLQRILIITV